MFKNLLSSPLFVGGVIPLIFFGLFNFFYKPLTARVGISTFVIGISIGGIIVGLLYHLFFEKQEFSSEMLSKNFLLTVLVGLLWGAAALSIIFSFKKLDANASQIIPIINANALITVLLAILFLGEKVVVWKILTGSILIILGIVFLV